MQPNELRAGAIAAPLLTYSLTTPMVKNGDKPVLSWTGSSNATYLMLYDSNAVDVSDVQTWSPPDGLTQMTTFILQVSAQQAGQTATVDFSITIEVSKPSLTVQDLTVLTTSTLEGTANVGVPGTPAKLVVNGDVQVGKNLTVAGPLSAQAALNVTGPTTLENDLKVSGAGTFNGGLTANNGLTAGGVVSIFGARQKLNGPGSYIASTDGFVMGTIYPPTTTSVYQDFTIWGSSRDLVVCATGGGTLSASAGSSSYYHVQTGGMFILPVAKGEPFSLAIPPFTVTPPMPFFAFWWFPLGAAPITATQTIKKKSRKPATKKKSAKKKAAKKATKRDN